MSETADFSSHHIEGMARAAKERGWSNDRSSFQVPLISHIEGNLWTGGWLPDVTLPPEFKNVLSLFPWEKYKMPVGCHYYEATMYDAAEMPSPEQLDAVVTLAAQLVEEGQTLIHCQAGLNRSGLVAALVLVKLGRTGREAIDLLREKRCEVVLCNQIFEEYLLALD